MNRTTAFIRFYVYDIGVGRYLIVFLATYRGGERGTGTMILEGVLRSVIWPFLIYDWLFNGAVLL